MLRFVKRPRLTLALLPGLFLGGTRLMPCAHHGMGPYAAAMPMAHHAGAIDAADAAGHAARTNGAHTDHEAPTPQGPAGHVPCTCAGGCPGSAVLEAPPAPPHFATVIPPAPTPVAASTLVLRASCQIAHLLPWPLAPPSSA